MAYIKTQWKDYESILNADCLNKIEHCLEKCYPDYNKTIWKDGFSVIKSESLNKMNAVIKDKTGERQGTKIWTDMDQIDANGLNLLESDLELIDLYTSTTHEEPIELFTNLTPEKGLWSLDSESIVIEDTTDNIISFVSNEINKGLTIDIPIQKTYCTITVSANVITNNTAIIIRIDSLDDDGMVICQYLTLTKEDNYMKEILVPLNAYLVNLSIKNTVSETTNCIIHNFKVDLTNDNKLLKNTNISKKCSILSLEKDMLYTPKDVARTLKCLNVDSIIQYIDIAENFEKIKEFVYTMSMNKITVQWLTNNMTWRNPFSYIEALKVLDRLNNYNKQADKYEKIETIHYEIEPKIISDWHSSDAEFSDDSIQDLIAKLRAKSIQYKIKLSITAPYWLDEINYKNSYGTGSLTTFIANECDTLIIKAYNLNRFIELIRHEIVLSKNLNKKVSIVFDTTASEDQSEEVTYFDRHTTQIFRDFEKISLLQNVLDIPKNNREYIIYNFKSFREHMKINDINIILPD